MKKILALLFVGLFAFSAFALHDRIRHYVGFGQSMMAGAGVLSASRDTSASKVINIWTGKRLIDPSAYPGSGFASIFPVFGTIVQAYLNDTVKILNLGISGIPMMGTDGTVWHYRNAADHDDLTTRYGFMLSQIVSNFGAGDTFGIICLQGESDADSRTCAAGEWAAALVDIQTWFAEDVGYKPRIFVIQIGRRPLAGGQDTGTAIIQADQETVCNDTDIFMAAVTYPEQLQADSSHLTTAALDHIATWTANTVVTYLTTSVMPASYRFRVLSSAVADRKLILTLTNPVGTLGISPLEVTSNIYTIYPTGSNKAGSRDTVYLHTDFSYTGQWRYAWGKAPNLATPIYDTAGRPLEPVLTWQTKSAVAAHTSKLTFDDKNLNAAFYFSRVQNKPAHIYQGNYPVYPSAVYSAVFTAMADTEGYYTYTSSASGYFTRYGTGDKYILTNVPIKKDSASRFAIVIKLRYSLATSGSSYVFSAGNNTNTIFDCYVTGYGGSRTIYFRCYKGGTSYGVVQTIAATLPSGAADIQITVQSAGSEYPRIFIDSTECSYGFRTAYSGGTYTWGNMLIGPYGPCKIYDLLVYNDTLADTTIRNLARLPNNLNLWGWQQTGNALSLSTTGFIIPDGKKVSAFRNGVFTTTPFRKRTFN